MDTKTDQPISDEELFGVRTRPVPAPRLRWRLLNYVSQLYCAEHGIERRGSWRLSNGYWVVTLLVHYDVLLCSRFLLVAVVFRALFRAQSWAYETIWRVARRLAGQIFDDEEVI